MMNRSNNLLIIGASLDKELALKKALSDEYVLSFVPGKEEGVVALSSPNSPIFSLLILPEDLIVNEKPFGLQFTIRGSKDVIIPFLTITSNNNKHSSRKDSISFPIDSYSLKNQIANKIVASRNKDYKNLSITHFDPITGIYNRAEFLEKTHDILLANKDVSYGIFVVGIIGLSLINSFFGNKEGDKILSSIEMSLAQFASRHTPSSYGRVRGDVFAFAVPYKEKDQASFIDDMKEISKEILSFHSPAAITLNYGVAFVKDNKEDASIYLDEAMTAFERASHELTIGEIYTKEIERSLLNEQEIIADMEEALQKKQFVVYYQPKYDLRTGLLTSCEALVRWIHPTKGLIPPNEFIPIFERTGFISKLDEYVWDEACHNMADWIKKGEKPFPISLNVSRVDIYSNNIENILTRIREKYDLPASLMNLEITESVFCEQLGEITSLFHSLKKQGYLIEMDDFGSKYSSLNILRELDFDVIKLDATFFKDFNVNSKGAAIIKNIISLAHDLHMSVVAEGIEKEEQAEFLRFQGCDYVQGYLYSKPIPKAEFEKLLEKEKEKSQAIDFDPHKILSPEVFSIFSASSIPSCLSFLDKQGELHTLIVNQVYKEVFGEEAKASDVFSHVLPEYQNPLLSAYRTPFIGSESKSVDYRRIMANGSLKWIRVSLQLLHCDKNKENRVFLSSFADITLEKVMEKELSRSNAPKLSNDRILLLGSHKETLTSLIISINGSFQTREASSLQKANEMMDEFGPYGLFIIDLCEKKDQFRNNPLLTFALQDEYSMVPIIAICEKVEDEEELTRLVGPRLNEFILKPFKEEMTPTRIRRVLEESKV